MVVPTVADYELAKHYVQHFAAKLRAGDALHLAIAANRGAQEFYTLNEGLLNAATALKVSASRGITAERSIAHNRPNLNGPD